MKKLLLQMLCVALCMIVVLSTTATAVCPVCTVAVGAGLEGARLLGVEDVITGIWAGGLTVSLIAWTANYMRRRGVKNRIWYILNILVYYGILACVYWFPLGDPIVKYNALCMWGIDQFMLGTIVGSFVFAGMAIWYENMKKNHGGHAYFPFQKVVMPFGGLLIATLIFWAILRWLPAIGIVVC